jgi:hypothetical protein
MSNDSVLINLAEWPYDQGALSERLHALLQSVQTEGKFNMSRLEGITVAKRLATALKDFDAGYKGDHAAAMRESVAGRMITTLRGGRIQGHIFFSSGCGPTAL